MRRRQPPLLYTPSEEVSLSEAAAELHTRLRCITSYKARWSRISSYTARTCAGRPATPCADLVLSASASGEARRAPAPASCLKTPLAFFADPREPRMHG